MNQDGKRELEKLVMLAMDCIGEAVTIIDPKGAILYYNRRAAEILDRKPGYLGLDIHLHHSELSNNKIDFMLQKFSEGRKEPFPYGVDANGKVNRILSPIRKDGQLVGCV